VISLRHCQTSVMAIPGKSPVPRKGPRSTPPGPVGACISENEPARLHPRNAFQRSCRGARLGAVSEHAYSAVAEYVSFDWIRKEIPVRLDGDWADYLEGFRGADLE
jgi:hypothetical protein